MTVSGPDKLTQSTGFVTQANSVKRNEVVGASTFNPLPPHPLKESGFETNATRSFRFSFSRDLSRLDADGNSASKGGDSSSSEEESSEEEEDPQERIGQLPPIADSDSEEDTSGLVANINSTLSTAPPSAEDAAVSNAPLRTGAKLTADQVAEARKARKAQAKKGTGKAKAPGEDPSDSESEEEVNENKKVGKTMKITDLGAPKEMSRRERSVNLLPLMPLPQAFLLGTAYRYIPLHLAAGDSYLDLPLNREQAEKLAAKERYVKMHAAGKVG